MVSIERSNGSIQIELLLSGLCEVITQVEVRFTPTASSIKKQIDSLIAQKFLERDENDRSQYSSSPQCQASRLLLLLSLSPDFYI
jgi:hypothetical protein